MSFDIESILSVLDFIFSILREIFGVGAIQENNGENEDGDLKDNPIRNV